VKLSRRIAMRVSAGSRQQKIRFLAERIPEGSSVLVVGVSAGSSTVTENVIERWLFRERQAVGLSYDPPEPGLGADIVRGDARRLPFADASFDYLVSNAVIEHVGGVEGARAMLDESKRVARRAFFHTTPNRCFPIEVHTRVPVLHWAPHRWQDRVFRRFTRYGFPPERYWLFTPRAARRLSRDVKVTRMGGVGMTLMLEGSGSRAAAAP
jgi:hypothetical protein